jgi:hypothetical protein
MNTAELSRRIVCLVINNLNSRKGFDWWWHDVDDETKLELMESLIEQVELELQEHETRT